MVHKGSWNEWENCWINIELTDVTQRSNGKQDSRVVWVTNYTTNYLQSLAPWKKLFSSQVLRVLNLGAALWVMLAQGIWWSHSQTIGWDCSLWTGCRISFQSHVHELLLFSCSVLSDSLQPHRLQHARPLCPSSPGVCSNSSPMRWWSHPTISSSVVPFSSCLQSSLSHGNFYWAQYSSWLLTEQGIQKTEGQYHIAPLTCSLSHTLCFSPCHLS